MITFWSSSFLFFFLRTIASYCWAASSCQNSVAALLHQLAAEGLLEHQHATTEVKVYQKLSVKSKCLAFQVAAYVLMELALDGASQPLPVSLRLKPEY
jgi:hypothetical protein